MAAGAAPDQARVGAVYQQATHWVNSSVGAPVHSVMIFDYDLTPQTAESMDAGTVDFVWGAKAELVPHWRAGRSKDAVVSRRVTPDIIVLPLIFADSAKRLLFDCSQQVSLAPPLILPSFCM